MLKDMHNSVLGVWSSHRINKNICELDNHKIAGEGKFAYRSPGVLEDLKSNSLICFRYTDGHGHPTQIYPANPNGSQDAVAGICSHDGRHLCNFWDLTVLTWNLGMMPHPDRAFLQFQWPEYPNEWARNKKQNHVSPWIRLFENAYNWSAKHIN